MAGDGAEDRLMKLELDHRPGRARYALVNPNWDFTGSTYFGCRDPHTPLELLFAAQKIAGRGHDSLLIDAQTDELTLAETRQRVEDYDPDFLVIPSAPSYLFWRCPPPELRVPREWFGGIADGLSEERRAVKVLVGPHGSATPAAALRKSGADAVIRGECEEALAALADEPWELIDGLCFRKPDGEHYSTGLGSGKHVLDLWSERLPRLVAVRCDQTCRHRDDQGGGAGLRQLQRGEARASAPRL